MNQEFLLSFIDFIKQAELIKVQTRTAWLSNGTKESVAEHTWRMGLMAMCLARNENGFDLGKVLKMCQIHDLGEACEGDISATQMEDRAAKLNCEELCLNQLLEKLPESLKAEIMTLWDEYNAGETEEAKFVRGLDKLETIIQHNQGCNPEGFDYRFNLDYGKACTDKNELLASLRELVDRDTLENC